MEHAKQRKSVRGKDYEFDLHIGLLGSITDNVGVSEIGDRRQTQLLLKACNGHMDEGLSIRGIMPNHEGILETVNSDGLEEGRIGDSAEQSSFKDKKKRVNNKKPSKPPRPPKGPSLNASDHKLIQEISEFASLKRARVERIRALKKARAASTSSSQSSNVVALIFTILFFAVIIFHGMSPRVNSTPSGMEQASSSEGRMQWGFISAEHYPDLHVPIQNEPIFKKSQHEPDPDVRENKRRRMMRRMLD